MVVRRCRCDESFRRTYHFASAALGESRMAFNRFASCTLFRLRSSAAFAVIAFCVSPQAVGQIDFRTPERDYVKSAGSIILVERQLLTEDPAIAERAVARLQEKITHALSILPKHSRPVLEKIPFYVMYGPAARGGGLSSGLEYFQRTAPEYRAHLDLNWRSCVVVYSGANYTQLSDFWALKAVIHELSHAWQLEHWPEQQAEILAAWQNSVQLNLHRNVRGDTGNVLDASYASTNQLEYFAELSCMYFVGCDYEPFNREELKTYDPIGYTMIEQMWAQSVNPPRLSVVSTPTTADQSEEVPSSRQWMDSTGNPIVTARFKSYHKGIVTVVTTDNSEAAMALNVFCHRDQVYVLKSIGAL